MSQVEIKNVGKNYGAVQAVLNSDFSVESGEFFSLLGPSGCGKTTTLRMIAGFIAPSAGRILVAGQDVTNLAPEKRNIGIVFQNYAIFPHMTVAQNIGYGLKLRRLPKAEIASKVGEALARVGLSGYEDRTPVQLSGGEQQRVALARVIVLGPRLLLLDEPLSALDKRLRDEMRIWLKDLQHELGITTIYVTHDQDEALSLSDRIAVMSDGVVQQIGKPDEIYERPATRFVADFIGESNLIPARFVRGSKLELEGGLVCNPPTKSKANGPVTMMVRPERLLIDAPAKPAYNRFEGKLRDVSYHGSMVRYHVKLDNGPVVRGERPNLGQQNLTPGKPVSVGWHRDHSVLLPESD